MATVADLIIKLKAKSRLQTSEGIEDDDLEVDFADSLIQHNRLYSFASLPVNEEELVLILAWIRLCFRRASKSVMSPASSGTAGFIQNDDSPYKKNIDLANQLQKRYNALVASLPLESSAGGIVVTTVGILDSRSDRVLPPTATPTPPPVLLELAAGESTSVGTTYILNWYTDKFDGYYELVLFHTTGSDALLQTWNFNSDTGVPRILNGASKSSSFTDQDLRSVKVTDINKAVTNRFILVQIGRGSKYTYSNELALSP